MCPRRLRLPLRGLQFSTSRAHRPVFPRSLHCFCSFIIAVQIPTSLFILAFCGGWFWGVSEAFPSFSSSVIRLSFSSAALISASDVYLFASPISVRIRDLTHDLKVSAERKFVILFSLVFVLLVRVWFIGRGGRVLAPLLHGEIVRSLSSSLFCWCVVGNQ